MCGQGCSDIRSPAPRFVHVRLDGGPTRLTDSASGQTTQRRSPPGRSSTHRSPIAPDRSALLRHRSRVEVSPPKGPIEGQSAPFVAAATRSHRTRPIRDGRGGIRTSSQVDRVRYIQQREVRCTPTHRHGATRRSLPFGRHKRATPAHRPDEWRGPAHRRFPLSPTQGIQELPTSPVIRTPAVDRRTREACGTPGAELRENAPGLPGPARNASSEPATRRDPGQMTDPGGRRQRERFKAADRVTTGSAWLLDMTMTESPPTVVVRRSPPVGCAEFGVILRA